MLLTCYIWNGRCIFPNLLIKDSSWTIHENNIHTLLIEIHKSLNHISPPTMQNLFDLKVTPYNLRNKNLLRLPKTDIHDMIRKNYVLKKVWYGAQPQIDIKI